MPHANHPNGRSCRLRLARTPALITQSCSNSPIREAIWLTDRARIPSVLHEVLAARDSVMRAVFIIDNPHRSWADIDYIRASAAAAGGQAFDAERSGRLPIKGWRVVRSDSAR